MKIKLKPGGHDIVMEGEEFDFFYSPKLYEKLEILKKLQEKNWDVLIGISGVRGSGKSTLGMQTCRLLDPNFTIDNVCVGISDLARKIGTLPAGSAILLDEASLALNSKDASTKIQKNLLKLIDVCRQRRLAIVSLLPSIFDLQKGIVEKLRFLLHTYTDNQLSRGYAVYFGESQVPKLYYLGKDTRSYSKPSAMFAFKFSEYQVIGEKYQALKRESLQEIIDLNLEGTNPEKVPGISKKDKLNMFADFLAYCRSRDIKPSTQVVADYLQVSLSGLNTKIAKFRGQNYAFAGSKDNNPTKTEEHTPAPLEEETPPEEKESDDELERNTS